MKFEVQKMLRSDKKFAPQSSRTVRMKQEKRRRIANNRDARASGDEIGMEDIDVVPFVARVWTLNAQPAQLGKQK